STGAPWRSSVRVPRASRRKPRPRPRPATPSRGRGPNPRSRCRPSSRRRAHPPHFQTNESMGTLTGFMEYERLEEGYLPVQKRLKNHREFVIGLKEDEAKIQTARCMDCGTPFCVSGCPVNNIIPDFNDLVYRADWKRAFDVLRSTNNFPEFT